MPCRNAPIQDTWIGYPNTIGFPTIDYLFTDSLSDPLNIRQNHVEYVVRLVGCFLCYKLSQKVGIIAKTPNISSRNGSHSEKLKLGYDPSIWTHQMKLNYEYGIFEKLSVVPTPECCSPLEVG